jgi:hypothetical protein
MTLDASGRLLVGTSTPAGGSSIQVSVVSSGGGGVQFGTASGGGGALIANPSGGIQFYGYTGAQGSESYSERMRLDSSGNLGLGVTPSAWISSWKVLEQSGVSLASSSTIGIVGQNWYINSGGTDTYRTTAAASAYKQTAGAHSWLIAPSGTAGNAITFTQAMSLTAGGNLLVGLTAPTSAERFSVWRDNVTTNSLVANIQNQAATSTTKVTNTLLRVSSNANGADAAIQLTDNTANNYWFGGNNGGAYVVASSNGVRLANGGTSWASDSDERVKDIIEPITDAVNKVSTLRSVIGKYKTDANGTRRSFLIAQDVQAVLPEAVFDEKGTLMLAYTDTIPLLVAAIKELKLEFDAYKAAHP